MAEFAPSRLEVLDMEESEERDDEVVRLRFDACCEDVVVGVEK